MPNPEQWRRKNKMPDNEQHVGVDVGEITLGSNLFSAGEMPSQKLHVNKTGGKAKMKTPMTTIVTWPWNGLEVNATIEDVGHEGDEDVATRHLLEITELEVTTPTGEKITEYLSETTLSMLEQRALDEVNRHGGD